MKPGRFSLGLTLLFTALLSAGCSSTAYTTPVAPTTGSTSPTTIAGSQKYADGILPLGDNKYTTDGPKKGYIYLCRANKDGGGAQVNGSWISGNTWDSTKKIHVLGDVPWPDAAVTFSLKNGKRVVTTKSLPTNHNTGIFPVQKTDPAYAIDRNPSTISAQDIILTLPGNPTPASSANCVGGEVGIMTNGVVLFNGLDAGLRDAQAHEVQDSCDGHPQGAGEYHYHGLSSCFTDTNATTVIGYAFDGFPITGPKTGAETYLTTDDLDECHGMTSEIVLDGKKTTTYHYVMTKDYPYSVSCFKGTSGVEGATAPAPTRAGR